MGVFVGKNNKLISNNTCHFGSMSGLPSRVGVRVAMLDNPRYGLHCRATKDNNNCCCLPISQTWHMDCKTAKAYLKSKGLLSTTNQTFSGGVGNRVINMMMG